MSLNSSKYNILVVAFLMLFFVACQKGDEPVPFSQQETESGQIFSSQREGDLPLENDSNAIGNTVDPNSGKPSDSTDDGNIIGGDDNEDDDDLDNGVGVVPLGNGETPIRSLDLGGGK